MVTPLPLRERVDRAKRETGEGFAAAHAAVEKRSPTPHPPLRGTFSLKGRREGWLYPPHFSPLMAMPWMIMRWKMTKKMRMGRMDRIDMANIGPYCETLSWLVNMRSARGTV